MSLRIERDGDVAVCIIDNPPINAASAQVRQGLWHAMAELREDATLRCAVLIGAGGTFIAGSDLREVGQALHDPQLPAVIAAIEACGKPVVAALHGAALGGGYEVALGCDARVASPGTLVGLPEVTLGIIPGAGGTQRLPRLVGEAAAIRLVCSGERIDAAAALELGMIDDICAGDLRAAAVAHARRLADGAGKRLVRELAVPGGSGGSEAVQAARAALKAGRQRPAVRAAIEAIGLAATLPFEAGLAEERALFHSLRNGPDARALRHQFFAERSAARQPALAGVTPRHIARIAVVGAGTMGAGIAISALDGGFEVVLLEMDGGALERGRGRVQDHYASRVAAGKLAAGAAQERLARFAAEVGLEGAARADLVIEAVFEDLAVKQDVFRTLDRLVRPGAVLASNTSYLDLDAIAQATGRPADVVGLHFFSPAHVMRLLEVVQGADTAPDVLQTALQVAKRLGKVAVVARNAFGFIGNRVYAAYRRQCEFLLEEGAYPEQVDAALEAFGFAMGPFAVADMSGLDIAWRMRRSQAATRDPLARYVAIPDLLCEQGRYGRKTGAGYYRYEGDGKGKSVDPQVTALIDAASAAKGLVRRAIGPEEITRRALMAMVNEAALLLAEGVARQASDIDVVLVNGYSFPRWEGGAVHWARTQGLAQLNAWADELAAASGPGFQRANPEPLLADG